MEMSPYLLNRVNRDGVTSALASPFVERPVISQLGPDRLDQSRRRCVDETHSPKFDQRHVPAFLREHEDLQRRMFQQQRLVERLASIATLLDDENARAGTRDGVVDV